MMKGVGTSEQKKGEKILNNYKKQLAERMAREKVERGELLEKKYKSNKTETSSQHFMEERVQIYDSNDIPDPQILEAILNRKSKYDKELKH